jgi:hypothetical protein
MTLPPVAKLTALGGAARVPERLREVHLGLGRIVASETEAPNMLVNLMMSDSTKRQCDRALGPPAARGQPPARWCAVAAARRRRRRWQPERC